MTKTKATPITARLTSLLSGAGSDTLWLAEEGSKQVLEHLQGFQGQMLCNRWDLHEQARTAGIQSRFSDFDFADIDTQQIRTVIVRVPKERAVVHHLLNQCARHLPSGSELRLIGEKQSGIKTYAKRGAALFQCGKKIEKSGNLYEVVLTRGESTGPLLADDDYAELRVLTLARGAETLDALTKPGLFGWDKIDLGSQILSETLPSALADTLPQTGATIVDLGCGYGYLSLKLAELVAELVTESTAELNLIATDNNAAALKACARNLAMLAEQAVVIPSDAGDTIESAAADLVICNPPFHRGAQVEEDLTDRFLANAARILKPGAVALFVVNEFIPVPRKSAGRYSACEEIRHRDGFKVYQLKNQ
ncbi:methyltransferase [Biformimicrobium ophioploci]|uniref:16S rRNA (Guanine(1207)-N(2))-methyltransferase RsmC n=1 Tax=Biformimicrobium ophioploci TaxID=3036711 RepID=A0ABQ6M2Z7_9GAMM|nr:methyltransferase [Microbulbifer sp. NKW57]GMG88723.1 16S rRNA (guanine(1207)-N(2))-methyltransferase RsmC [Microbulbifer sp. NKW57]